MGKKLFRLVIALLSVLPLVMSCQNPATGVVQGISGQASDLASSRCITGPVRVIPCPNAEVDSSAVIQEALRAADPGETVRLEAGTYYIQAGVWVNTSFNGALRGAGMGKTVITTLPGHKVPARSVAGLNDARLSTLIYFQVPPEGQARIALSDFSIVVTDPAPAGDGQDPSWEGALYNMITVNAMSADTIFERLRLEGGPGGFAGFNTLGAVQIFGYLPEALAGNHVFSDCVLKSVFVSYNPFVVKDGAIRVTGNRFSDVGFGPVLEDMSNCTATVSGNVIADPLNYGITVVKGSYVPPENPSTLTVRNNTVTIRRGFEGIVSYNYCDEGTYTLSLERNSLDVSGFSDGIFLADWAPTPGSLKAIVTGNVIRMDVHGDPALPDAVVGGIGGTSIQNAVIDSNRISGAGMAGIYLGPWGDPVTGCMVKGNNVSQVTAEIARIWLGPGTSHCAVVGSNAAENVLDQGTDNVVTGMTRISADPLGQRIRDALAHEKERKASRHWK